MTPEMKGFILAIKNQERQHALLIQERLLQVIQDSDGSESLKKEFTNAVLAVNSRLDQIF
jgi:hypothetical protein